MFILENTKQLERAISKARQVKPLVRKVMFGEYLVKGLNGDFYTVKMSRNPLGQREIACNCKGAEKGLVCYHSASALELHSTLAKHLTPA